MSSTDVDEGVGGCDRGCADGYGYLLGDCCEYCQLVVVQLDVLG